MYVNDPIADMLTRIRNAHMARQTRVTLPYSQMKEQLARLLRDEGYVTDYEVEEGTPYRWLHITLKYVGVRRARRPVISGLERVSKPGRRIYASYRNIPWVKSGMGIAILTTPKGMMTDRQARRERVGGEILCYVW